MLTQEDQTAMLHRMVKLARNANNSWRRAKAHWTKGFDAGCAVAYTQAAQDLLGIWSRPAYTASHHIIKV
jgi:hypothetical protein